MSDRDVVVRADTGRQPQRESGVTSDRAAAPPDDLAAFLGQLALRLAGCPSGDAVDHVIHEAIPVVATLLDVDRCGLAQFSSDGRALLSTHAFARPGIPLGRPLDFAAQVPWYTEEVRKGRTRAWSDLPGDRPAAALPEAKMFASLGLGAHVMVPLRADGEILGCLGASRSGVVAEWPAHVVAFVERLAVVIAQALRRHAVETKLRAAEDLNRALLASVPVAMIVLDGRGFVTHVSDAWKGADRCGECPDVVTVGTEYLAALEDAPRGRLAAAPGLRDGVKSVLDGRRGRFETTYDCSSEAGARRFHLSVTRQGVRGGALILQTDVGVLEHARADLERSQLELRDLRDRLDAETACLRKEVFRVEGFDQIVGTSAPLAKVLHGIEQVAAADSPVLLLGETGTGKDLVARAIHERSRRRDRPLVPVNCAALPDALIESELFGYERGAFTGAVARTLGRFEAANGGSILLDEVGEMPLGAQAKLLRVLEAGTFERLGSSKTVHVDVRVIAATNRDLEKEVREGRFRADLYYRLNVFPVVLPPLRERVEDVPVLVWHFINAKQGALGRSIKRVPERLMRAFESYAWPGNVRELENVVERALIVSTGPTLEVDAPFLEVRAEAAGTSLDDVQRAHIQDVLRQCGWKVAGRGNAADRLGLKRGTLQFRMKKLGIRRPEPHP